MKMFSPKLAEKLLLTNFGRRNLWTKFVRINFSDRYGKKSFIVKGPGFDPHLSSGKNSSALKISNKR